MLKTCTKCSEAKPLGEFYAHPATADGLFPKCKSCARLYVRQHRVKYRERHQEADRTRPRRPKGVCLLSPEQQAAHNAVSRAVRSGKLSKLPCAFCGSEERLEAHHHDYSKPLEVTWLCSRCHRRFHALERMATYRDAA